MSSNHPSERADAESFALVLLSLDPKALEAAFSCASADYYGTPFHLSPDDEAYRQLRSAGLVDQRGIMSRSDAAGIRSCVHRCDEGPGYEIDPV